MCVVDVHHHMFRAATVSLHETAETNDLADVSKMNADKADKRRSWAVDDVDYTCLTTLPLPSKLHVNGNSDSSEDETSVASSGSKRAKLSRAIHKRTSPIKAFFGRFKSGPPPTAIPEEAEPAGSDLQPDDRLQNSVSESRKKRSKLLSDLRFKLSSGRAVSKLMRSRKSLSHVDTEHHRRSESQDSGYEGAARLSDVVDDTASCLDRMIFTSPVATPTGESRERAWTLPNQTPARTPSFAGSRSLDDKPPSLIADMLISEIQEKMKYKHMVDSLTGQDGASSSTAASTQNSNVEIRPAVETNHSKETNMSNTSEPMEVDSISNKLPSVLQDRRDSISSLLTEEFYLVDNEYVMDIATHRELVTEVDQLKDQLLALQTYLSDPNSLM